MNGMRNILLTLAIAIFVTAALSNAKDALATSSTLQNVPVEVRDGTSSADASTSAQVRQSDQAQKNRCELVTVYAQRTRENYQNNYTGVTTRILAKLDAIIDRLTSAGINTTTLETNVAIFSEKAKTCGDAVGLLASYAETAKENVCTDANALRTELQKIKEARAARFEACKDMKEYYQTEVKPAVQQLREELRSQAYAAPTALTASNTQTTLNTAAVQGAYAARPVSDPEPTYQQTQNILNKLHKLQ